MCRCVYGAAIFDVSEESKWEISEKADGVK